MDCSVQENADTKIPPPPPRLVWMLISLRLSAGYEELRGAVSPVTSSSDHSPPSARKDKDAQIESSAISAVGTATTDISNSTAAGGVGAGAATAATTTTTFPTSEPSPSEGEGVLVFSALRQKERELTSRVGVLDYRMARARPEGLLEATVSASAVVSFSAATIVGTSGDGTRDGNAECGNTVGGNTGGDNTRDDTVRGGGGFGTALGDATGTRDGVKGSAKRHRRRSVSLMPTVYHGSTERGGGSAACDGTADGSSRRRPWTTSRCDEVTVGEKRNGERGDVTPSR